MTEVLPTIKVKHKEYNIEMIINECDFDEKIHEIPGKEDKKVNKKKSSETIENNDEQLKALMGEK